MTEEGSKYEPPQIRVLDLETAGQNFIRAYNDLARVIHADNVRKGFWNKPRNVGEMLMLCVSELGEALEADRKDEMDQHLQGRIGIEVELADCIIRIMDMGVGKEYEVAEALIEKLAYNRTRPHKHGKRY